MKKLFITSDVHSYYDELMTALDKAGFDINNEKHIFVSCGDLFDRGCFPRKCLQFVNSLPDNRKILIRGNHEDLAMSCVARGYFAQHDMWNGTMDTIQMLSEYWQDPYAAPEEDVIESFGKNPEWLKYYDSTVDYKEVGDYIFTHGWIPSGGTKDYPIYEANWREKSFNDAKWVNGMDMWNRGVIVPHKTVVCGHWHASYGNVNFHRLHPTAGTIKELNSTFKDKGIIALDSTVPRSKFLNVEVIEIEDNFLYI